MADYNCAYNIKDNWIYCMVLAVGFISDLGSGIYYSFWKVNLRNFF
jgi:hypothetical protein